MRNKFNFKKLIIALLSAACVSAFGVGAAGCMPKSVDKSEPTDKNVRTDRLAPPTDGSLPTAYSCAENLAYIVGKFDSQTQYHSYTDGVTSASIATQTTRNWKDYKNGVLINSDITYSSMVKGGTQTCTVFSTDEEGNKVADTYFRTSATPSQSTTSTSAEWNADAPTYFSESAYLYTYGFLPDEPFNYAVNADTIISSEEIKAEADGTYTLTFNLDPSGSTFYYQFGMKTRGGLSDYPEFQSIKMTVNFDRNWQINTCDVHEVSKINKGIVVTSVSDFSVVYSYGSDGFDDAHFAYYEDYYKNYVGDDSLDNGGDGEEELVLDVTSVLSNGFANIMNGGQQFEISATLGENKYFGYVYLALDLEDIAGSINLKLSLGKELGSQTFYVEYANGEISAYYGEDFALGANLAAVKLEAEKFGEVIGKITASLNPAATEYSAEADGEEEGADPMTALMNDIVLTSGTNQALLTLDTDDLLGLGIGIKADLLFGISGNTITFRGADVGGISIGGETLDLAIGLKTTTAALISHNPSATPADLAAYVADVYSLLNSDLIKVTAELNGDSEAVNISALKGLNVRVDAYADLCGVALGADAYVSYTYKGNKMSAKLNVLYEYNANSGKYGRAYLSLTEFNGAPFDFNVTCGIDELVSGISALLNTAGAESGSGTDGLVSILNSALSADLSSLLTDMYADSAKIKIGVDTDLVLNMLGVNAGVSFGSCELVYALGDGANGGNLSVALPAIGFSMNVCGADGELPEPDQSAYLDLSDLLGDIVDFTNVKTAVVGLSFDGSALGIEQIKDLTATATAYVDLNNNITAKVVADIAYGNITANIIADYVYDENTYGLVVLTLSSLCGIERNVKLYCNVDEVIEGVKTLLNYFGTEESATEVDNGGIDLSNIISSLLTADINAIIPNLEAKANILNMTLNADEVIKLLGLDLGIEIGEVSLNYTHGGANLLVAEVPNFGISATVNPYNGQISAANTNGALNLKDILDDVNAILNSKKLAVGLSFNGSALGIEQIKDLTATATAYVDLDENITAMVQADVIYKLDDATAVTASFTAYYVYDGATYGDVILSLDSFNGVKTSVKVCCNIGELKTAVETLIAYVLPQNENLSEGTGTATATDGATEAAAGILETILTADFNGIINYISTDKNVLNLSVNADAVLDLFGIEIGAAVGDVTFKYTHPQDENTDMLYASVANYGVELGINPTDYTIQLPDTDGCLDLAKLVGVVNGAIEQVNDITDGQKIYFEIAEVATDNTPATYLYLDGIRVQIWGKGEISWKEGAEYVALDLAMSISESGTDVTTLKLVYDKNAVSSPIVKLAINNVGISVYSDDVDEVKNGFVTIYNKLAELLGLDPILSDGVTTDGEEQVEVVTDGGASSGDQSTDELLAVIFSLLARKDWVTSLGDFTAKCDGRSVALMYLADENSASVNIGVNGGLYVNYNGAFGERFMLGGTAKVNCGGESGFTVDFDGCDIVSSKEGETAFIRLAYNYLFDCIRSISVKNILGSSTYAVTFELNGANTDIADFADVYIKADIYITDEASVNDGKMAEGLLNLDVAGVAVNLHVICEYDASGKAQFYINLTRVADILLPDLKLYATQDSLYETFKVLFDALKDTNIAEAIIKLAGGNGDGAEADSTEITQTAETGIAEIDTNKLASLLEKVLNFNFSEAVISYEEQGIQYADIDLDALFSQLGLDIGGHLGTLAVEINHKTHAMTTSGVGNVINADGNENREPWITLSSAKTDKRSYSEFKREDYLNIEFLPCLIEDVVNFATDDSGNMYETFTFSGTISASIVNIFNITIDVRALTLSLADNDFYFSAVLHVNKMSALGLVTIPESTVGITYQGGYLTLARGLNSTPEYRITTMDYFIDHMLVKNANDSVLQWWLNVSGWDTVVSIINNTADLNVSSGLTTTKDVYLYKQAKSASTQLISIYDYLDALSVKANGAEYATFGDMSDLESEFGISDNYYGFKLNSKKVTGGVLTKLYAAILRNDGGISGVKASGAISSYVTFSATLNYEEGLTENYVIGNTASTGVAAPSMYLAALEIAGVADNIDFDHYVKYPGQGYDETFGSFNIYYSGSEYYTAYSYSNVLYSHTLTVVDLDGSRTTIEVRHGSTVYLYDNYSPIYADDANQFRLLYTTVQGEVSGTSVVMYGDLTVYAYRIKAVNVILVNSDANNTEYKISSFVGDKVPTEVDGRETIGDVTYGDGTTVQVGDVIGDVSYLKLYGTFAQSVVEVDGVNYKFIYDNENNKSYYIILGKADSFDTTAYTGNGAKTLVLQSEINGYPVTAIADNAFANTDGHSLRSVIVPASITYIGEQAFLDNVGMETAVFLAETVTVAGSFKEGESGNTTPFYGCSTEESATSTSLKIYYNTVIYQGSSTDLLWTRFRRDGSGSIYKRYYIGCDPRNTAVVDYDKNGGGALYSNGQWSVVSLEVSADCVTEINVKELANANLTVGLREGVYSTDDGKILEQTITEALSAYTGDYGEKYVVNVNVTNYYGNLTVSVKVSLNEPVTVNIYSSVAFSYTMGSNVQQLAVGNNALSVIKTDGGVILYTPEATGYTFLGWAMNVDGTLTFIDGNNAPYGEENVYYAIWGTSKVGAAFTCGIATSGTALPEVSGSGIDGSWYDASWNKLTDVSTANTVVYTRSVFTFKYTVSGNLITKITDSLNNNSVSGKSSLSGSFSVLEGQTITGVRSNDGYYMVISVDGAEKTTLGLEKYFSVRYTFKDSSYNSGVVTGNVEVTFKY